MIKLFLGKVKVRIRKERRKGRKERGDETLFIRGTKLIRW